MGSLACDLLDAELALDRLEAELARELPGHLRVAAAAYARGQPGPPAPAVARQARSLVVILDALAHPVLADRALPVARIVIPLVIDEDPRVVRARTARPTWDALAEVAAARDLVAVERFGHAYVALVHRLHGSTRAPAMVAIPPSIAAWQTAGGPLPAAAVGELWHSLAARHGARGTLQLVASGDAVRPRTYVIAPGTEALVVLPPRLDTPALRFAALHELGHAVAALVQPAALPRGVDEAAAAYVARLIEVPGALPDGWHSEHATPARHRRLALATTLDAIEQALPAIGARPAERPPWALWHDPAAQAAYVEAEHLATRWWTDLGPTPTAGAFARAIAAERERIDRAFTF